MHKCFRCGTLFEGKFCPECGTPRQEEKTCPNCGATLAGSAKFCNECGYSFLPASAAEPQPSAQAAPPKERAPLFSPRALLLTHKILRIVPAALFALMAALVFAFLAAPVLEMNLLGLGGKLNAYRAINEPDTEFLRASIIALIVFAALSLPAGAILCVRAFRYRSAKGNRADFVPLPVYLAFLVIASIMISGIKKLDGGMGAVTVGACPVLILVFAIVFALFSATAVVLDFVIVRRSDELNAQLMEENRRRAELIANLTPPVPPQPVEKPRYRDVPKSTGIIKIADKYVRNKFRNWAIVLFPTLFVAVIFSVMFSFGTEEFIGDSLWGRRLVLTAVVFDFVYCLAALIAAIVLTRRMRVTTWSRKERSAAGPIALTVITALPAMFAFLFLIEALINPVVFGLTRNGARSSPRAFVAIIAFIPISFFIIALVNLIRQRKLNLTIFGTRKPKADALPTTDVRGLNGEYLKYYDAYRKYENYRLEKAAYGYEKFRYSRKRSYESKPPRFLLKLWANKLWISVTALILAVLIAVPCIVFPVLSNKFSISIAQEYKLQTYYGTSGSSYGGSAHTKLPILPKCDRRSDTAWEYFSGDYKSILKKIEKNNQKIETVKKPEELDKIMQENKKLGERLAKVKYKYLGLQFEYGEESTGRYLRRVLLDTSRCDSAENTLKTVKRVKLSSDKFFMQSYPNLTWEERVKRFTDELNAEIFYGDGSYQHAFVPSYAFAQIDFSKEGEYTVAWQDGWGSYSAAVTVVG